MFSSTRPRFYLFIYLFVIVALRLHHMFIMWFIFQAHVSLTLQQEKKSTRSLFVTWIILESSELVYLLISFRCN